MTDAERTWVPSAVLDATRIGGANYSSAQMRLVLSMLGATSVESPISTGTIALQTGVEGRTVRQILQDLDGRVCLIGKTPDGVFLARVADDGESMQQSLESAWRTTRDRCRLRREYIERTGMARRQLFLGGFEVALPAEFEDGQLTAN